jgi:integrase
MQDRVTAYLRYRRQLGYRLAIEGAQLERFAEFAQRRGYHGPLTLTIVLAWAGASRTQFGPARRLEVIRPFAKYCQLFEPDTAIPPTGLLGPSHRRVPPHIYTTDEINALLGAAKTLEPRDGLRPATIRTYLGLLAATGLRVSEALALNRQDVDLDNGVITVQCGKFGKTRLVPLGSSTVAALAGYCTRRDYDAPWVADDAFFCSDSARRLSYNQACYAFQCLRRQLGWARHNTRLPRMYDLRHTFACRRLRQWYEDGVDVNWALPQLSTYLGHVKVSDTYWYLTAVPELMTIVTERFEHFMLGGQLHE